MEFTLLRRARNRRIGRTGLNRELVVRLWTAALVAAGAGWGVKLALAPGIREPAAWWCWVFTERDTWR